LLDYDPDTGIFRWRVRRGNVEAGTVSDHKDSSGHVQIRVDNRLYLAHRLAWLYTHGEWPPEEVDHVNRIRHDNRLDNLRLASRNQNMANSSRRVGKSGLRGVIAYRGKWKAQINAFGVKHYLGLHATKQEAHDAYCKAARSFFGEHASVA
jgi:hypothetical protein